MKRYEARPTEEITETLQRLKETWEDSFVKNTAYTELIESDEAFEQEEKWLKKCMEDNPLLEGTARDYLQRNIISF